MPLEMPQSNAALTLARCPNHIVCAEFCNVPVDATGDSTSVQPTIVVSTSDQVLTFWDVSTFASLGMSDTVSIH